jgi:uncharacterized membrane protein YcjF (UPF0283 family)
MNDRAEAEPQAEDGARLAPSARRAGRSRLRRVLLAAIAVLYLVSVPWYRDADAPLQIVFGLPDWVAVALACYVAVAVLNAIAWRLTEIPDLLDPADDLRRGAP